MNNPTMQKKIGIAAMTALLCGTACSPLNEPAQTVTTGIAASTGSAVHASSETSASESESSSLSPYISEVSSSESSQTETSSEDVSSSSDAEATVKAEETRAAEKAQQEEELRIQQAEQEKARQEAEAALKAEQEKAAASQGSSQASSSQPAETPSKPAEKPADFQTSESTQSEPQSVEQQSGKYALNEYGNPSIEVLKTKVKVMVNPADPALQKKLGGRGTLDPNVTIPNPWASMQPISPYIGQANPPAAWPKPVPGGSGEYRWSPEAGCWRYYRSKGTPSDKYVSIYGVETWAQSVLEESNPGASMLKPESLAHAMGIYGV